MANEPENIVLRQLREMRAENERQHQETLARFGNLESTLGKVIEAVTQIANVQDRHSSLLGELVETQRNQGARLNAIDGRLALIEKHTGMVNA